MTVVVIIRCINIFTFVIYLKKRTYFIYFLNLTLFSLCDTFKLSVAMCRQYWTVDVGYGEVNIVNVIMVTCYGEW